MLINTAKRFVADEHGATAVEYGLIAALIAVAIISTLVALGDSVVTLFGSGVGGAASTIGNAIASLL